MIKYFFVCIVIFRCAIAVFAASISSEQAGINVQSQAFYSASGSTDQVSQLSTGNFYYNLDSSIIETQAYFLSGSTYTPDGTWISTLRSSVKNNGTYTLENVSWAVQFAYDPTENLAYTYDNAAHAWYLRYLLRGTMVEHWVKTYEVMGQQTLLSMDRNVTEAPLSLTEYNATASLAASDAVTLISYGNIKPGETVYRDLYVNYNNVNFALWGNLLHTTPEPATLLLLGLGGIVFRKSRVAS